jgi:hypothetical protein
MKTKVTILLIVFINTGRYCPIRFGRVIYRILFICFPAESLARSDNTTVKTRLAFLKATVPNVLSNPLSGLIPVKG